MEIETCEDCGHELIHIGCPACDEVISEPDAQCEICGTTLDIVFGCLLCAEGE